VPGERRRLPPSQRRTELVEAATKEFAAKPYQDVLMTDIATRAEVSRALLYQYFPAKRDLFAAVYQHAASELVAASTFDPDLSLIDQVLAGLDAHFDFFEAHTRTVLVANRGEMAGDPVIETIINDQLTQLRQVMLDAMGLKGRARQMASTALYGWLAFVRAVCVDWLAEQILTRNEVRDMCVRSLLAALDLQQLAREQFELKGGYAVRPGR
jgi:AcrR family transcriptional regulator